MVPLFLGRPHVHLVRYLALWHGGTGQDDEVFLRGVAPVQVEDGVTHKGDAEGGREGGREGRRETERGYVS